MEEYGVEAAAAWEEVNELAKHPIDNRNKIGTSLAITLLVGIKKRIDLPNQNSSSIGGRHDRLITYRIRPEITPWTGTRATAITRAWRQERSLVWLTGKGTHDWTPAQAEELIDTGSVAGFTGHHINNVESAPAWRGDPRNIRFLSSTATKNDHLHSEQGHRGNFANPTSGRLIDREAMIRETMGFTNER